MVSFMGITPLVVLNTVVVQVFAAWGELQQCHVSFCQLFLKVVTGWTGLDHLMTVTQVIPVFPVQYVAYSNTVTSPLASLLTG